MPPPIDNYLFESFIHYKKTTSMLLENNNAHE